MTSLPINQDQLKAQLKALGYKKGDKIFLRKFPPKGVQGYPKNYEYTIPELPKIQDDDGGLYLVINSGGHTDKEISQFRAVFFEFDDRPVEDQVTAWHLANLPEPSMQVLTRKSVHTYYIFSDDCSEHQWRELQEDLIDYLDSDKNLKNPSRVMRVAGAWHIAKDQDPMMCEIIHQSEVRYTYAQLRAVVPRFKQLEPQLHQIHDSPLSDVLHRDILPRLSPEQIYNWEGHKWQRSQSGKKYRGCCPWHTSESGTAFYIDHRDNSWLWRCPSCEIGGTAIEYRHRLKGGNGHPKGKEFVDLVKELADIAGVALPEFKPRNEPITSTAETTVAPQVQQPQQPVPTYEEALNHVSYLEDEFAEDAELEWQVRNYAYDSGLAKRGFNGSSLLRLARTRKDGAKALTIVTSKTLLERYKDGREWLITGVIPLGTTIVCGASGGTGKSSLANHFVKCIQSGTSWGELTVKKTKCLIIQADEPESDMADKLDIANFYDVPAVDIIQEWRFSQVRQLEQLIRQNKYQFIVIDSFTACNAGLGVKLTESSAGDPIYLLKSIAQNLRCTFLIIHHNNKMNDLRDSSTINDNPSEIWKLYRDKDNADLGKNDLFLEITKSRAGLAGKYLLRRNPIDYSWEYCGSYDSSDVQINKVVKFIKDNPGDQFSVVNVSEQMGIPYDQAATQLEQARRFGLISAKWMVKDGEENYRFRLYFAKPELRSNPADVKVDESEEFKSVIDVAPDEEIRVTGDDDRLELVERQMNRALGRDGDPPAGDLF